MNRVPQIVLILSTVIGSWLGMQAVHELGHVLGVWVTGGRVERVVLHPLTISRTDVAVNPRPLAVAWAGPMFGVFLPVVLWMIAAVFRMPGAFVLRFFAGFCLLANGLYIACGSFAAIGDCGDLLRHGGALWQLWLFGAITAPAGLALWNKLGSHFGVGHDRAPIGAGVAYGSLLVCCMLLALALLVGGQ